MNIHPSLSRPEFVREKPMSSTFRDRCCVILAVMTAISLAGCMQKSLSDEKISTELLNGLSPANLENFHYAFEGNQAGYAFLARFSASEEDINQLVRGAAFWGKQTPSVAMEGGIPTALTAELGTNYELNEDQEVQVWRRRGQNRMTSSFIHFTFLLPDNKTVYFYGTGI